MTQIRANAVLARALSELGWSPRDLSRQLNRDFGPGTVSATAPYHWRDHGRVPRAPLPHLTAQLLSRHLGHPISCADLWGIEDAEAPGPDLAGRGFDPPVGADTIGVILDDWVESGLIDRRPFLAISGATLLSLATGPARPGLDAAARPAMDAPLLDQLQATVPMLQRLDDATGGGRNLAYVGAHFRAIAVSIRRGHHPVAVERGLLVALADVGQLAGWMAFDAGQHALAQRYYLTALHVARHVGYRSMAAHILADLAFQAATREHPHDAVVLGERAADAAAGSSVAVRATVATRLAYAYAIAGRLTDFDRAYRAGLDHLASGAGPNDPAWMYFLTPGHLHTQAGYALIHAAIRDTTGRPTDKAALLRRGQHLLRDGAHDLPPGDPSERRALFEGSWLAVAAAHLGDHETAWHHGHTALGRLPRVQSQRSTDVLTRLGHRLRRATRNPYARDLHAELRTALQQGPT